MFPHMRSIEAGDVEEERRLFYVGVTRARNELFLTFARRRTCTAGGTTTCRPASSTRSRWS